MRVVPTVFPDADAIGHALAELIADELAVAADRGHRFLLGCPGGRSALSTYRALAREVSRRELDLSHLVIVMMDEYVEPDTASGAFRWIDPLADHSCVRFGNDEIVGRLNEAAGPGRGITPDRLWVPDPANPELFDKQVADQGGVDLFILATGASDGHIAFNPAGASKDARTRVVTLAEQTRRDNLATFPTFADRIESVPLHGVTVGVGTIHEQSKRVVMVVHGADKADAADRLIRAEHYEADWPSTILTECVNPRLFIDVAARRS